MKALTSKKNINEYTFSDDVAVAYIKALQLLHADNADTVSNDSLSLLERAGLYSNGKLRVFNYKKPKENEIDYLLSKEIRFLIPKFNSAESSLWYKPRFKYQRESLDALIKKYGFRKAAYLICVMIPAVESYKEDKMNEHEFIPNIDNPSTLLTKLGSFSKKYIELEVSKYKKLLVNNLTAQLERDLETYGIHKDT